MQMDSVKRQLRVQMGEMLTKMGDMRSKLESKVADMEGRLGNMVGKMADLEGKLGNIMMGSKIEGKMDELEGKLDTKMDMILQLLLSQRPSSLTSGVTVNSVCHSLPILLEGVNTGSGCCTPVPGRLPLFS